MLHHVNGDGSQAAAGAYELHDGDTVSASITGNIIRAYINGNLIDTVDVRYNENSVSIPVISSGAPGIGFFSGTGCTGQSHNDDFGFTSFTATSNQTVALSITTTSLPNGVVGTLYSTSSGQPLTTLSATGGQSPYTFDNTSVLPAGLSVPPSGSGTWGVPTASFSGNITVRVTDNASTTATKVLPITIAPAPIIGNKTLPNPAGDTFINAGAPYANNNYDGNATLRVYQAPQNVAANKILLDFDISPIPANKIIQSANLQMTLANPSYSDAGGGSNPMALRVYRSTPFTTSTVTWNNFTSTVQPYESAASAPLTPGYLVSFSVKNSVTWAYANSSHVYLVVDGDSTGLDKTNRIFNSYESGSGPQLIVTYSDNTTNLLPPNTPTGHSVSAGDNVVYLHPGTASGAVFYTAYYTRDGSTPTKNSSKLVGVTDNQAFTGLTDGVTYEFAFTASNASGESSLSSVDTATPVAGTPPIPSAPTGVRVTSLSGSVVLYPGTSSGAVSYNAYYTSDGSTPTTGSTAISPVNNGTSLGNLANGTTYKFVFTAVNVTGESPVSVVASATPSAQANKNFLVNGTNFLTNTTTGQRRNYLR
jgi:hypothetical protein